jgi:phosphotransferase system HPr (HPr) family protein
MWLARTVKLTNKYGLHARPAMLFTQTAGKFNSEIAVVMGDRTVDGKAMLEVMTLAAERGTELVLKAKGPDADEALDALTKLVDEDFGEA